jgi:hypothetical protein
MEFRGACFRNFVKYEEGGCDSFWCEHNKWCNHALLVGLRMNKVPVYWVTTEDRLWEEDEGSRSTVKNIEVYKYVSLAEAKRLMKKSGFEPDESKLKP